MSEKRDDDFKFDEELQCYVKNNAQKTKLTPIDIKTLSELSKDEYKGKKVLSISLVGFKKIDRNAFKNCPFQRIYIANIDQSIKKLTFKDCGLLEKLVLGKGLSPNNIEEKIKRNTVALKNLKEITVKNCPKLEKVNVAACPGVKIKYSGKTNKIKSDNVIRNPKTLLEKAKKHLEQLSNNNRDFNSVQIFYCNVKKHKGITDKERRDEILPVLSKIAEKELKGTDPNATLSFYESIKDEEIRKYMTRTIAQILSEQINNTDWLKSNGPESILSFYNKLDEQIKYNFSPIINSVAILLIKQLENKDLDYILSFVKKTTDDKFIDSNVIPKLCKIFEKQLEHKDFDFQSFQKKVKDAGNPKLADSILNLISKAVEKYTENQNFESLQSFSDKLTDTGLKEEFWTEIIKINMKNSDLESLQSYCKSITDEKDKKKFLEILPTMAERRLASRDLTPKKFESLKSACEKMSSGEIKEIISLAIKQKQGKDKIPNFVKLVEQCVNSGMPKEELANMIKKIFQYETFEFIRSCCEELSKKFNLSDIFPKETLLESESKIKSEDHHYTGVYLWAKGYRITKLIGEGGCSVVWQSDDPTKVYKVDCASQKVVMAEKAAADQVQAMFNNEDPDLAKQAKKYLHSIKYLGDNIFESDKANGDIQAVIKKKQGQIKEGKTIRSVLRMARQALKEVKKFHDNGSSHNDIKPENFLQKDNPEYEIDNPKPQYKKDKHGNEKKVHKHKIVLTDFGLVSKIDNEAGQIRAGTEGYAAPDLQDISPEAVAKRDVYSLGVTFLYFLMGRGKHINPPAVAKELMRLGAEKWYDASDLQQLYTGTSKKNIIAFLNVIQKMLAPQAQNRISLDETIKAVKALKYD